MKPHGFMVYLPPELYLAVVKLQADKQLGRVYPVLYAINEGLYRLGYISKEVYEIYEKRYSEKLIREERKPLTKEQLEEQKKLKELETIFSNILKQGFHTLPGKSRQYYIAKAEEYRGKISNAKLILALANGEGVSNER